MSDNEPKDEPTDDSEQQSEDQPADSDQSSARSGERPAEQTDQSTEQSENQATDSDQSAAQSDQTCRVRLVKAPDGTEIPVPAGGIGLPGGMAEIRDDAEVQIHPKSANGYYVVVNNAQPSNDEAADLFSELTVEGAITTLEHLASEAFAAVPSIVFKGLGFTAGVLVSLFTTSKLTQEVFIRGALPDDGTPITYCLLL